MLDDLTPHEMELLEILGHRRAPSGPWGAWVTAALEGLLAHGLAEPYNEYGDITWFITPGGEALLEAKDA